MKLNIGSGKDIREGWINLDIKKGDGIDIVHDLNTIPLPFEENKFDFVLCQDVLEHINFIPIINEIHRILKKGGKLKIRVPHFTSKLSFEDPTHVNQFSIRTFDYFVKNLNYNYERDNCIFSRITKKIIFDKSTLILKLFNNIIDKWVNKSEKHQNFYESSFLRIFPAMNIEFLLIK